MERKQPESIRSQRHPKGYVSPIATNLIHLRNPWVMAWWAASYLGFAYFSMGSYIKGFIFIFLETFVNVKSRLNLGILYSFTGRFEEAKQVLDINWLLFYVPLYIFSIWGAQRLAVDLNKLSILADREESAIIPMRISSSEINFFDKRNPWVAAALSFLMPGIGHLYTHRIPSSFYILGWWILIVYMGNLLPAVHYTMMGAFEQATAAANPQWVIFLPSVIIFAIYDSYVNAVEYNRLYELEQSRFLIDNYQHPDFELPFMAKEM